MPIYEYSCGDCDQTTAVERPYTEREKLTRCRYCGGPAEYRMSAPMIGGEVKRGDNRLIFDERQVTAEKGEHWREVGTTGKEGGAGLKLTFDQGRHSA